MEEDEEHEGLFGFNNGCKIMAGSKDLRG